MWNGTALTLNASPSEDERERDDDERAFDVPPP